MELSGKEINHRYRVIEKIGRYFQSVLWSAEVLSSGERVVVQVLAWENSFYITEGIIRFKRTTGLISKLSHPNIASIIEINEYRNHTYLVYRIPGGINLSGFLARDKALPQNLTVRIIMETCLALIEAHGQGIVHGDLSPENIWLLSKYNQIEQIKLAGFGFVEIKELTGIREREDIVNTFSYMSPEACGIINKKIDERSDMYSLGIIMYRLLTGQLPFNGETLDEILHMHITLLPEAPSSIDSSISRLIDRIVLKLLSKDQEERYQSAAGLLADLKRFRSGVTDFDLGLEDRRFSINFKTALIGRSRVLEQLKKMFNRACVKQGAFCLISGETGLGKTRFAEELKDYTLQRGGFLLYGKCFAGASKGPYRVFYDILNDYLDYYRGLGSSNQKAVKDRIINNIGALGRIIVQLNPAMEDILGDTKPLVKIEPERENSRFLNVCSKFFYSLGENENPLVIFLDDLQWADESSLALLSELLYRNNRLPFLLLGTYRKNEILPGQGLNRIKENYPDIDEITLEYFSLKEVKNFVQEILSKTRQNIPDEFAEYLRDKSRGNPFFIIEIMRALVEKGIISSGKDGWEIDIKRTGEIDIPRSIVDTVFSRIKLLNDEERTLLATAACIGVRFQLSFLYSLTSIEREKIINIIDRAMDLQLLESSRIESEELLFVHDRIRDVFYDELNLNEKKGIHLKIAERLEYREKTEDLIFALAHHYIMAGDLKKALEYSIPAGMVAKMRYAFEDAERYFRVSLKLLEKEKEKNGARWMEVQKGLGEVYLTSGNYDESINTFKMLLPLAVSKNEKALIYSNICSSYFRKGDFKECEIYGKAGLKLLGESLPTLRPLVLLGIFKEALVQLAHRAFPEIFIRKKENPFGEKYRLMADFYLSLCWSYLLSDINKFIRSVFRILNLFERKLGTSKELASAVAGYAVLCMGIPKFERSIEYHEKALSMREELEDYRGIGESYQYMGYCYQWMGDYKKSIELFEKSMSKYRDIGDVKGYEMSLMGNILNYNFLSDFPKVREANKEFYRQARKSKDVFEIIISMLLSSFTYIETGDIQEARYYALKAYNMSIESNIQLTFCISNILLGHIYSEVLDKGKAIMYLERARVMAEKNKYLKQYTVYLYTIMAFTYINDYIRNPIRDSIKRRLYLKKIKKACKLAVKKTKNWITYYGISLGVASKYYSLAGNPKKSLKLVIQSVESITKIGYRYFLGRVFYEYALVLKNMGFADAALSNFRNAYAIFEEIGSLAYLKKTSEQIGLREVKDTSIERFIDKRKLSSIVAVSQQISSILNIDDLLENIVSKAIESTGAMRGFLFIFNESEGRLELKASKNIEESSPDGEDFQYSSDIVEDVFTSSKVILTHDALEDKSLSKYTDLYSRNLKSILCFPIFLREKSIGVFYLGNRLSGSVFSEDDIELLNVFFAQAAISIENAGLYSSLEKKIQERTEQLRDARSQLAQMAEVATGVLHNIGNMVNSVTISNEEIIRILRNSRVGGIKRANELVRNCGSSIGKFIASDSKGMLLPGYFFGVEKSLRSEYNRIEKESKDLENIIMMMRDIIITQQEYARIGVENETVDLIEVVEDSLKILKSSMGKYEVLVKKNYNRTPALKLRKSRLNHVLLNVFKNACETMEHNDPVNRILEIEVDSNKDGAYISISDNGEGIPEENIDEVFRYGFTTRSGGHGFGLNTCMHLITEMGGRISARSRGAGQGSTFLISFPLKRS